MTIIMDIDPSNKNGNTKIRDTQKLHKVKIGYMSLPARITCPCKKHCEKDCYADAVEKFRPNLKVKYTDNLELSKRDDFVDIINAEIDEFHYLDKYIRLHTDGDFYSADYFAKWVKIALANPDIIFYAYTKSVKIVKDYESQHGLPKNMSITYSYGGTQDDLINPETDKHVIVISQDAPAPAGYVDGSHDDLAIVNNQKVYLRYHGKCGWDKSDFRFVKLPI